MFESKKRALFFMVLSICFAIAAAFLFSNHVKKTEESLGQLVEIQVAKKDIPAGSPITLDMLEPMKVPKKYVVDSYIKSINDLKGKISLVPIPEGEVLTKAMMRNVSKVPSQFRLVQLRAPMAVFDDMVDVRDKVDLVGSYEKQQQGQQNNDENRITDIVIRDVEVIRVYKKGEEIISIGVALTHEDAKRVVWMLNYGKELRVLKSNNTLVQIGGDA